jgi:ABC-type Na+ efflux pump permease subunit
MLLTIIIAIIVVFAALIYFAVAQVPGKALTIAQAAYRESVRQPLFWLLVIVAAFFMLFNIWIPYFTFGEDLKMAKGLQLDSILLVTLILSVFSACISVSEEIEARTAITVLSKPMSRRQFLVGKFLGIFIAAFLMAAILSIWLGITTSWRADLEADAASPRPIPSEVIAADESMAGFPVGIRQAVRYVLMVVSEIQALAPGIVCNLCQVMILTAVAVALATRLPLVVNLVICLMLFFVGRLAHVLVEQSDPNKGGNQLVHVMAQIFATLLPGFNYFDVAPALVNDIDVPWAGYVDQAAIHAVAYTAIALLFGLILFEDRDVA